MGYEKTKYIAIMNILDHIKFETDQMNLTQDELIDFSQFLIDEISKFGKLEKQIPIPV
jgi:hypothetical protein